MDPMHIPCCPYCDMAIEEWDEHKIVVQHGSKFLTHAECEDDDESEQNGQSAE